MKSGRGRAWFGVLALLVTAALLWPSDADARGRRKGRGFGHFGARGAFGPHYGYGPWGLRPPEGGINMQVARLMGWGALDLKVKPGKAEVWVDGRFVGRAKDLDGRPSYLWLDEGAHTVAVYRQGYVTFEKRLEVTGGEVRELKLRLERGESKHPMAATAASPGPPGE